jgi:hypothetical protein
LKDVEDEAGDGYAVRKKEVGFLAAEALLEFLEGQRT